LHGLGRPSFRTAAGTLDALPPSIQQEESGMTQSIKTRLRPTPARGVAFGAVSSLLRLAARERQAHGDAPAWLQGLTRALRAGGPGSGARPLHAVLAGGDCAPSEWRSAR